MTKKNLWLVLLAVALATVYVLWFSDWLQPKTLAIFHTDRNLRPNARFGSALTFAVGHQVRFTELKVVPLAAYETNKHAPPLWHLVSDSNSVPVKVFFYGQPIGGMRPFLKGARPEMLQSNVTYRLFITAGRIKGQHDFELK